MNGICPACNGMLALSRPCVQCGALMEDTGPVSLFYGPYSPYADADTLVSGDGNRPHAVEVCVHLLTCAGCGYDRRVAVGLSVYNGLNGLT